MSKQKQEPYATHYPQLASGGQPTQPPANRDQYSAQPDNQPCDKPLTQHGTKAQPPQKDLDELPQASCSIPVEQPKETGCRAWCLSKPDYDFGIAEDKLITEALGIKIRHGFIRKVYGLLSVMLMVTFGLAAMFNLWEPAGAWIIENNWLVFVLWLLAFIVVIVLVCVPKVARRFPINIILLGFISLSFGVILGFFCALASTFAFSLSAGITAAVTIALTLFAIQTKWDFTGCGVFVLVSFVVLTIMGVVMIFVRNKIAHIAYASLGALLFSFYMVYDTQQIVGGRHRKFQYSIDDYVFAALTLFMDVINLFMYILSIVSGGCD